MFEPESKDFIFRRLKCLATSCKLGQGHNLMKIFFRYLILIILAILLLGMTFVFFLYYGANDKRVITNYSKPILEYKSSTPENILQNTADVEKKYHSKNKLKMSFQKAN